jgi:hypothetical protein
LFYRYREHWSRWYNKLELDLVIAEVDVQRAHGLQYSPHGVNKVVTDGGLVRSQLLVGKAVSVNDLHLLDER